MRDFIHIEDCVDGVLLTMDKIENGDALNLSTGIFTSFKEFARMAAQICGYSPEIKGTSNKPEGVFARGGHTGKQESLEFRYQKSFVQGVTEAMAYYERQVGGRHA